MTRTFFVSISVQQPGKECPEPVVCQWYAKNCPYFTFVEDIISSQKLFSTHCVKSEEYKNKSHWELAYSSPYTLAYLVQATVIGCNKSLTGKTLDHLVHPDNTGPCGTVNEYRTAYTSDHVVPVGYFEYGGHKWDQHYI